MMSLKTVMMKEFSDNVVSKRFIILFSFLTLISIISAFASRYYTGTYGLTFSQLITLTSASIIPLISKIGPLIGIMLGFDSISKEIEKESIILLLSCPIYRDTILNGKILGGVLTIALAISTSIMVSTGIMPTTDEAIRLIIYLIASIIYISMYMAISVYTSIATKNTSMSLLISIIVWLTFTQLIYNASNAISALIPEILSETRLKVITAIRMLTPDQHYNNFSMNILNAKMALDPFGIFPRGAPPGRSLTIIESLAISWPNLAIITSILIAFIAASYIKFLREEVRC
jgi:ABC-2 type transport system permease protein